MYNQTIEEFGKRLVRECRDQAIWAVDLLMKPDRKTGSAQRWRAGAASTVSKLVPAYMVIPDSVDAALGWLLLAIDQDELRLSFTTIRGETIYLPEDGSSEMCGWYGGGNSWHTWYSKERIVDADDIDISNLIVEHGTVGIPDDPAPNLDDLEMPRRAIEELGILFVRHVRDVAIQSCDMQLLPHSQTAVAKRWRRAALPFNGQVPPQVLIPDCVDEAIFAFLRAIDQGLLPLSYVSENGETVDLVKEGRGELAARYMAPDGWRAKYSKERINQDVADI